jgi:hypothetical protein
MIALDISGPSAMYGAPIRSPDACWADITTNVLIDKWAEYLQLPDKDSRALARLHLSILYQITDRPDRYGPLGVIMALLLPSAGSCPFCYEPVHIKATICPHCRSTLSPPNLQKSL